MKLKNKVLSMLLALIMVLGVFAPGMARALTEDEVMGSLTGKLSEQKPDTTKLIVHKLKATEYKPELPLKSNGGVLTPEQLQKLGTGVVEVDGVTFTYYKLKDAKQLDLFNANPDSYKTADQVEKVDGVKNGNGVDIQKGLDGKATNLTTIKTDNGDGADVNLSDGYYWFIETDKPASLTDAKAVPFGIAIPVTNSVQGTTEDGKTLAPGTGYLKEVNIYPKNLEEKPKMDKNFDSADYNNYQAEKTAINAMVGTVKNYEVKTKLPMKSSYKKLVWSDFMDVGLTYNKDVVLEVLNPTTLTLMAETDYKIKNTASGFKLSFTTDGLKKLEAAADENEIELTLKYSATINEDAVIDRPMENNIELNYNPDPKFDKDPNPVNPTNQEITVTKTWTTDGGNAPDGVKVTYYLYEKSTETDGDKIVASASLKQGSGEAVLKTDESKKIGFEITDQIKLSGKFTGLDDSKTYYVKEIVEGYSPQYIDNNANGTQAITNHKNPDQLIPTPPKVETYGKKFVKTDGQGTVLAGAKFIIKNNNDGADKGKYLALKTEAQNDTARDAYYNAEDAYIKAIDRANELKAKGITPNQTGEAEQQELFKLEADENTPESIRALLKVRNEKFEAVNMQYKWVEIVDPANLQKAKDAGAYILTSNEKGQFEIKGLAATKYQLVEVQAPKGFAELKSPVDFNVGPKSYTEMGTINYETSKKDGALDAQEVQNKKVTIPQTGGIGTTIFTGLGLSLMVGAVIALKRNNKREEE